MMKVATIRPLDADDIKAVGQLFMRHFRKSSQEPPHELIVYLDQLFSSGPFADPAMPSLVHVRPDGAISGFIGVTSQPMKIGENSLNVAVCGALMVDGREADPLAGARLLKSFLSGSQDLSLSETAGDATLAMWRQLRGDVLSQHSLDWLRVIRPGGFALETGRQRMSALGIMSGVTGWVDGQLRRSRAGKNDLRWATFPDDFKLPGNIGVEELSREAFVAEVQEFTERFPIRRDWSAAALAQLGDDIGCKSAQGALRLGAVVARGGMRLGAFAYYERAGATARVLDILAAPRNAGLVIDSLLKDAAGRGAVAVRGRTSPALFDALLERRCLMFRHGASVISSPDRDLVARFQKGDAHFNGVVGERWSRLVGDEFLNPKL